MLYSVFVTLAEYHRLVPLHHAGGSVYVKPGARGYADPRYELLARAVEPFGERALDLNPGVGLVGAGLLEAGLSVEMIETSRACLLCLEQSFGPSPSARIQRGLPWEVEPDSHDMVVLVLPGERGSRYVELALWGASRALRTGGRLWIAGDTRKGFDNYLKWAKDLLGYGLVTLREGSLRVAVLEKENPTPPLPEVWQSFTVQIRGHDLRFEHLPGVFSAGHLDPASALLLQTVEDVSGHTLLDLGGGYGGISLPLAREGAVVSMTEDDWVSLSSAEASLRANGLGGQTLHSDVEEALPQGAFFDIIVSNPPFHLGGEVILDVAQAFVQAAKTRLRSGGRFYLVANPFLKYEPILEAAFGNCRTLAREGYKVLLSTSAQTPGGEV